MRFSRTPWRGSIRQAKLSLSNSRTEVIPPAATVLWLEMATRQVGGHIQKLCFSEWRDTESDAHFTVVEVWLRGDPRCRAFL